MGYAMKEKLEKIIDLTNEASIECQRSSEKKLDNSYILALKFWKKYIQNNKSIVSLIELGFVDEAFVIQRLSFEHLFNMLALIRNKDFIDKLKNSSKNSISKAFNALRADKNNYDSLTQENKRLLEESLDFLKDSLPKNSSSNIYDAARNAELPDFYNSVYRVSALVKTPWWFCKCALAIPAKAHC